MLAVSAFWFVMMLLATYILSDVFEGLKKVNGFLGFIKLVFRICFDGLLAYLIYFMLAMFLNIDAPFTF